jgi:hypothetical protein
MFLKRLDYLRQSICKTSRYKVTKAAVDYLNSNDCPFPAEEKSSLKDHLSKNLISQINYPFINQYLFRKTKVFCDKNTRLYYVLHDGKRLYFKRGLSKANVRSAYNTLCCEQDVRSPHSYRSFHINYQPTDIAVDAGAAEGIWALSIVDRVKALYLFNGMLLAAVNISGLNMILCAVQICELEML